MSDAACPVREARSPGQRAELLATVLGQGSNEVSAYSEQVMEPGLGTSDSSRLRSSIRAVAWERGGERARGRMRSPRG